MSKNYLDHDLEYEFRSQSGFTIYIHSKMNLDYNTDHNLVPE